MSEEYPERQLEMNFLQYAYNCLQDMMEHEDGLQSLKEESIHDLYNARNLLQDVLEREGEQE